MAELNHFGSSTLAPLLRQLRVRDGVQSETLAADATLTARSANWLALDPGGADRVVTLPAEADSEGLVFVAHNAADAAEVITIEDDSAATIVALKRGESCVVSCDGAAWLLDSHVRVLGDVNTETLAANKTIVFTDPQFQRLDAGGAGRTVTLPAVGVSAGLWFRVLNTSAGATDLTVKNAGAVTIVTVSQNEAAIVACDGTTWTHQGIESIALA